MVAEDTDLALSAVSDGPSFAGRQSVHAGQTARKGKASWSGGPRNRLPVDEPGSKSPGAAVLNAGGRLANGTARNGTFPANDSAPDDARSVNRDRDDADLPSAVVGTDDEFLDSIDVPEVTTAKRRGLKLAPAPPKPDGDSSIGAAEKLLDSIRVRHEEEFEDEEFQDEEFEDDGSNSDIETADGPAPPRRREAAETRRGGPPPRGSIRRTSSC